MPPKTECPRCGAQESDLSISDIDGYVCENCDAWFDLDVEGEVIFAYDHQPEQIGPF